MEHCKLQIGCMVIVLYVMFSYIIGRKEYKENKHHKLFEILLAAGIISLTFDGITAYTVNHLETVPNVLNGIFHMFFLCSLDIIVFMTFIYILDITKGLPKNKKMWGALLTPLVINLAVVIMFIPKLEYRIGKVTNYSMGIPVYACFAMVAVYMIAAVALFLIYRKRLERHKFHTISTYFAALIFVTVYQMAKPESLITALAVTIIIVGTYLNIENPLFTKLKKYNNEMVMGFATLVENKDDSTGGHIRRTAAYVELLAKELEKRGFYKECLTKDYIENLIMAAPMHDVGKIAIPDVILQKPGKLTDEEFATMKTHSARGGKIIKETFGHFGDDDYVKMAYDVARYHHEKWNGKGYPDGLVENDIPLCARIMAVSDVFDAVSAKRCYRDAMPLEKCFGIIREGSGRDFDPIIADVFLDIRDEIEQIYKKEQ